MQYILSFVVMDNIKVSRGYLGKLQQNKVTEKIEKEVLHIKFISLRKTTDIIPMKSICESRGASSLFFRWKILVDYVENH